MTPVPALLVAEEALRRHPAAVVLVDGRSGSGKTTFAAALAARTGASRLRLEQLYPGWDGLSAGSAALARLLEARVAELPAVAPTWDWIGERPGAPLALPASGPLVVEGCGALSRRAAVLADLRIWVTLPAAERRARALERDGAVFAPHWERWARQERAFLAREDPASRADVVVDGRRFPQQVFSDRAREAQ
ncbi:hypothetical protein [uncultured Amnibacterium sp.]|uniref:hypothetical protein n=1 Tax=uncultured Amnibacterium sp. TaxID=1631851 RepID=UPI0035CC6D1B